MRTRREFLAAAAAVAATPITWGSELRIEAAGGPSSEKDPSHPLRPSVGEAASTSAQPKIRGIMVDAGRVPETLGYYKRVIDFCSDWGLNTLQFRLTDDQGSAMRFNSVPGLVTHENALSPAEMKSLVECGRNHGVDLLPEIESFGHTGYITRSPAYAHLLDRDPSSSSAEFTGIIPVSPESLQIFEHLYREVADVFPSVYLHGGCDEVNWGGSALSRKALQTRTRTQIWAEYLNALHQVAAGLGKQFIVWGDLVLRKEPAILGQLDKKIIVMDWSYYDNSSASLQNALQTISSNGSRAIGAPALSCYRWGARVGTEQLRNIDAFADAYFQAGQPAALGVILTNWIPSRYVQCSIWDGFAYAAIAFTEGTATAQTSGFRRFVEKHYQARWNESWDEVFQLIYSDAPSMNEKETASWLSFPLRVPWSSDQELATVLKKPPLSANPFIRVRSLLVELEPLVLKNFADFKAFELCVAYLEKTRWRETILAEHADRTVNRDTLTLLIQAIAERDQELAAGLNQDWDIGRFPNAAAKLEAVYDLQPKDQLLYQWNRAAAYSAELAKHPDRFHQLMQSAVSA